MNEVERAAKVLIDEGKTPIQARIALVQKGFLEDEVDRILNDQSRSQQTTSEKKANKLLSIKETFDRLGYGFATPQFINILFWQSGAGLLLIGIMNGLKAVLSLIFSSVLQEYIKRNTVSKNKIADAGLVFGFSFFLMAFAALAHIPWLFALGFLFGSLGVVTYGDLYAALAHSMLKHEKRSHFLQKAAFYGVIISGVSLLLSGLLIDRFKGTRFMIGSLELSIHGFLLSFMITAFSFIIGSYILSKLPDLREPKSHSLSQFLGEHFRFVCMHAKTFLKNPYVFLLLIPATLFGLLQILGASYYGIYMYQTFNHSLFGGFTNVAVLYFVALLVSLLGPFFTKIVERSTGLAPHLVFGTLLSAILPLVLAKNPHYLAVMAALICSVIGASIVGTAQGLIAQKIMDLPSRKAFFVTQSFLVALPYVLFIPLGAWIASAYGLQALFLGIALGLCLVVVPFYFLLVALTNKMHL